MADARSVAVAALIAVDRDGAFSNLTLDAKLKAAQLSAADRSLATALFYGVLDRRITLDYVLSKYIKKGIGKVSLLTLETLRVALYQLMYLSRIPESAAVNEAVKQIKNSKERYNASFVNAVLRNYLREPAALPDEDTPFALSVRYSCPEWLVQSFITDYGSQNTRGILEESLKTPPMTLRVNPLRTTAEELTDRLQKAGIRAEKASIDGAVTVADGTDVRNIPGYREGLFHVQDLASQISIEHLAPQPGERVADLCAAPGGKTFTMAGLMMNRGTVEAFDLYEKRVGLIRDGAKRLGLDCIRANRLDATVFSPEIGAFDAVLCDVPCSGFGVLRRKPEIKYKMPDAAENLPAVQLKILENAACYLKVGGRILYSTCTLHRAENESVIRTFLDKNRDYELQYEHTYLPHVDQTDGFYCALLIRKR